MFVDKNIPENQTTGCSLTGRPAVEDERINRLRFEGLQRGNRSVSGSIVGDVEYKAVGYCSDRIAIRAVTQTRRKKRVIERSTDTRQKKDESKVMVKR